MKKIVKNNVKPNLRSLLTTGGLTPRAAIKKQILGYKEKAKK
jgi:hypothetical protein